MNENKKKLNLKEVKELLISKHNLRESYIIRIKNIKYNKQLELDRGASEDVLSKYDTSINWVMEEISITDKRIIELKSIEKALISK